MPPPQSQWATLPWLKTRLTMLSISVPFMVKLCVILKGDTLNFLANALLSLCESALVPAGDFTGLTGTPPPFHFLRERLEFLLDLQEGVHVLNAHVPELPQGLDRVGGCPTITLGRPAEAR